jgi:tetratricopeptide (TPR) repeat protein
VTPKPTPATPSEFELALDSARAGRFAPAVAQVQRALTQGDSREALATPAALALAQIARLASRARDAAAAEHALAEAVRLRPRFADLQWQYAVALLACQRRADARRALEHALTVNPRYAAARLELAMLDAREGMVGDAVSALRAMAAQDEPGDARAFTQGLRRLEHAEWDEAAALFKRALQLGDTELEHRLEEFHSLMRADQPQRAADLLREVLPAHETYPDLHARLGAAELRLGHVDDAIASLGRALELNPDFHVARIQFARALDAAGLGAAAQDQVAWVLQLDPEHAEALAFTRARGPHGLRVENGADAA